MKSKETLVKELVAIIGRDESPEERLRLTRHNMGRSITAIKETIDRWYAIQATTKSEINLHCQF